MTVLPSEVDATRLRDWLCAAAPTLGVLPHHTLRVTKLAGGYSNLTFEVSVGDAVTTVAPMILRRPPVGVRADRGAHDMRREFRVLCAVYGSAVPVPKPLALCEDESVLGGMFFLMSKVDGVVVRSLDDAPVLGNETVMRQMSEACIDGLAALHLLPVQQMPLYDASKAEGYGARQVQGWCARWIAARTTDVSDVDARVVFQRLADALPAPIAPSLLHNDWKFDNLVVDAADPTTIRGVLDWEMAAVGDSRFDLATSLGYWVEAGDPAPLRALALGVTTAPGCLTRDDVIQRYGAQRGITIDDPVYWWVFGLAKLAVVVLQLYARYAAGVTRDPRFASLGTMAELLMQTARSALERNSLRAM